MYYMLVGKTKSTIEVDRQFDNKIQMKIWKIRISP